jgi:hypothetical protein
LAKNWCGAKTVVPESGETERAGVLPRGLILERPQAKGKGCLAVGLNPGTSTGNERSFSVQREGSYAAVKFYWQIAHIPYYSKARRVIDGLGLSGPIIWSNLAKCENAHGVEKQLPPLQTLRHCAQRFLSRELELTPTDWPVLGAGWEADRALAYLVPERAVIGIPHPTGAYGAFAQLFLNGVMREEACARAFEAMRREPKAVWLDRMKVGAKPTSLMLSLPSSAQCRLP